MVDHEPRRHAVAHQCKERGCQLDVFELTQHRPAEHLPRVERGEKLRQPSVGVLDVATGVELGYSNRQRLGQQADQLSLGN
jgi:hypothetical protein